MPSAGSRSCSLARDIGSTSSGSGTLSAKGRPRGRQPRAAAPRRTTSRRCGPRRVLQRRVRAEHRFLPRPLGERAGSSAQEIGRYHHFADLSALRWSAIIARFAEAVGVAPVLAAPAAAPPRASLRPAIAEQIKSFYSGPIGSLARRSLAHVKADDAMDAAIFATKTALAARVEVDPFEVPLDRDLLTILSSEHEFRVTWCRTGRDRSGRTRRSTGWRGGLSRRGSRYRRKTGLTAQPGFGGVTLLLGLAGDRRVGSAGRGQVVEFLTAHEGAAVVGRRVPCCGDAVPALVSAGELDDGLLHIAVVAVVCTTHFRVRASS